MGRFPAGEGDGISADRFPALRVYECEKKNRGDKKPKAAISRVLSREVIEVRRTKERETFQIKEVISPIVRSLTP